MTYRPLPKNLTIKESNIEGLGLFAVNDIPKETIFGISHVMNVEFPNGYIRTPLGGFVNHSSEPNSEFFSKEKGFPAMAKSGSYLYMKTIADVKRGEELTASYKLYDPKEFINDNDSN